MKIEVPSSKLNSNHNKFPSYKIFSYKEKKNNENQNSKTSKYKIELPRLNLNDINFPSSYKNFPPFPDKYN